MADHENFPVPPPVPNLLPAEDAQLAPDALQQQRWTELQAAADAYAHEQKVRDVAQRKWHNDRERSQVNLMGQIPKLIGAVCIAAVLAYLIPLGSDR